MGKIINALVGFLAVAAVALSFCGSALAVGIKVVPSSQRVLPGEELFVDVVAEGIPAEGLGGAQFRLNVAVPGGTVAGVADLGQADHGEVAIASPLLVSPPTATRSGIGDFFWNGRGSNGILVMDNEPLVNGSALYTFAHTNGSTPPSGSGSVARFMVRVGPGVNAKQIDINLSEVMLLDGGPFYPLDYNTGATVQIGCFTRMPDLAGLSLAEATARLAQSQLLIGSIYEIDNTGGSRQLNVVLEQSALAGSELLCEAPVNLAVNTPPAEVTGGSAADKSGDDSGSVVLTWTPSASADIAGYRVYQGSALLVEIPNPAANSAEIGGLATGAASQLRVTSYDIHGNESQGAIIAATPLDDVAPVVTIGGVTEGSYYRSDVTPQVAATDTNLAETTVTLNGNPYSPAPITVDGDYTLSVTGTDRFGNQTVQSVHFIMDKTAPSITIAGVADGGAYNTDITPVISVADTNFKDGAILLNGQSYVLGSPVSAEGNYSLSVAAEDLAGNTATQTVTFIIDKTSPVSSAEAATPRYASGGVLFVSGQTPVAASAKDAGIAPSGVAGMEYRLDDAQGWSVYGAPVAFAGVADGVHTLNYRAFDRATNVETFHAFTATVDNTPPASVLTVGDPKFTSAAGENFATRDSLFTVAATDNLSGVATIQLKLDSGSWGAFAPFTFAGEGAHTFQYKSRDNLTNEEPAKSYTVTIDNTPPMTGITAGAPQYAAQDGTLYISGTTPVTLTAGDNASGVAGTEFRVDGSALAPYQGAFTIAEAGGHTIGYRSSDRLGNQEQVREWSVTVDTAAPQTEISVGSPKYAGATTYVKGTTTFTLAAMDDRSGVDTTEYRIDNGPWATYAPFSVTQEGDHVISWRSSDRMGNQEAAKTLAIFVDDTSPASGITIGNPKFQEGSAIFVASATTFTITSNDAGSGVEKVEYRADGGQWLPYAPFLLTGEGVHTIEYRAVDRLGNQESAKSLTVTLDATPPASPLGVSAPKYTSPAGTNYATKDTLLTITATDNLSGVASTLYSTDAGAWNAYAPFVIAAEGAHIITCRSRDNVENLEDARSYELTIDNTPPSTVITPGTPQFAGADKQLYVTSATPFTLTANDNLSGVARTDYRLDGSPWTPYALFTIPAEGVHAIDFRSADNVANAETERTLVVTIDNTPPVTAITTGTPRYEGEGKLFVTSTTQFTLAATDNLSGVSRTEYRIDGGAWTSYAPFTAAAEGEHVIGFRSIDTVGNFEPEKSIAIVVDNTPPVSSITTGTPQHEAGGKLYVTDSTTFTLSAGDNLSGVAKTEYRIDGGTWTSYAPFTIPAEGAHAIEFRSQDNLENLEAVKSFAIVVDNTPPVSVITPGTPSYEEGGKLHVTSATSFTLSATDNLSGTAKTEYRIDNGPWTPYAPFTLSSEGSHVIGYRSMDNLGNQEAEKVLGVIVDNTSPESAIAVGSPRYLDNGNLNISGRTGLTISATDNASGVKTSEYSIDGAPFVVCNAPIVLDGYPDGSHTIDYRSTDNVGNVETVKKLTVVLDKTPPQTTITASDSLVQGVVNTVSPVTGFTLTAVDDLSGIQKVWYRIDGGQWQLYTGSFTLTGMTTGSHNISFNAEDNVGNAEQEQTFTVRLIVMEIGKEISLDPVILVGAWTDNLNMVRNQGAIDSLSNVLSSLGINHHLAGSGDEFKRSLRSGRYNTYILVDYRDEKVGEEIREAVNYGDSLIFIKTLPSADPSLDDAFGVKFTGKTTSDNLTVILQESPLSGAASIQSSGKSVVGSVAADTAILFGYVNDKRGQYPSIVFNEYGNGKVLLYTFDVLNSADNGKVKDLVSNSIALLKPEQHKVHALDSVPVRITVSNSAEPLGLRVLETIPSVTTADTVIPDGELASNTITWEQYLGALEKAKFGYYLNLPDAKGDYTTTSEVRYANYGNYELYGTSNLTLNVPDDLSSLLQKVISDLNGISPANSSDLVILTDVLGLLSQVNVNPPDVRTAEKNIETVTRVVREIKKLSVDLKGIRLELDALLKVLEKKWYLMGQD